jgi:hypothetical protein
MCLISFELINQLHSSSDIPRIDILSFHCTRPMGSQTNYPSYIGPVWFRDISSRDRDNANVAQKLCSRFRIA